MLQAAFFSSLLERTVDAGVKVGDSGGSQVS
jgi:hypothetical protein